ncbi:MAG: hypothetical protein IGS03_04105 [Candidatus Sericytochromatia bacterium]|nr:hypothetical protein [Candidatus Sericytochromatia bacterium]
MSAETPENLPINVKLISEKPHIVLRLDQIQRAIIENPERFETLAEDRSLNHVRKEIQALQEALLKKVQAEARFELDVLKRAGDLLDSWENETELKDILLLDQDRREYLTAQFEDREKYTEWLDIITRLREERARIFTKYLGYFEGQQTDINNKREETQRKLKVCLPQMEEWRQKLEPMTRVQQEINFYTQKAMNWLVGALAILIGITLLGHFSGIWGGWFWGLIIGYGFFSSMAYRYAYLEGEPMKELHRFLSERFELKNVKPFFRFEDPKNPQEPTRYDATRGEVLSGMLQKEIRVYQQAFSGLERNREEHINYLQYLESRSSWFQEQVSKIEQLQSLVWQPAPERPVKARVMVVDTPASKEADAGFAKIPTPPPPAALAERKPASESRRRVRPSQIKSGPAEASTLSPDRVS